jgi:PTS system ascorbate-specific IIA component
VLTDMLGATPSNIAARLAVRGKVEVVAGVSLPMLVRALTYRAQPLGEVVDKATSGGREGVVHLGASETHAATGG